MEENKQLIRGINSQEEHQNIGNRDGAQEIPNRIRSDEQINDGVKQSEKSIKQSGNIEFKNGIEGGERGEHAPATDNGGRTDEKERNYIGINKGEENSV